VYLFWVGGFLFFCCQGGFSVSASLGKRTSNFGTFHDGRGVCMEKWVEFTLLGDFAQRFTVLFTTREFWDRKQDYI